MTSLNAPTSRPFLRAFLSLYPLGLLGVLSLVPTLGPTLSSLMAGSTAPTPPLALLITLVVAQSAVQLGVIVALGTIVSPALNSRSLLLGRTLHGQPLWPALRSQLPLALLGTVPVVLGILLLDRAFRPHLSEAWQSAVQSQTVTLASRASALLYGGVTEELLMRWGVMSLIAWALWRTLQRRAAQPAPWVFWTAIIVAALLFGLGHLPAVASLAPLDLLLVVRTIVLNAIGGLWYGWLFWRRSLEAGMSAHAFTHVLFWLLAPLAV
ncbi:CPBP family intramembrane glutamic endopeptidase [Deinococcus peraridilitoris]|uniref:CAAX amino terminal protease family n=1 Tax=Deinococcus peraridilitoris (strain DSM 19664 / LMG 22246 / CIP 109416 / KR-200) TaxID=937777 RepID=L0A2C7_DEIPD|nr:CPBP family intramembrane glutamic endopeptidase [Deinococcus peraridilitoris]AFZ67342.1 CAAX amino terminal protease family [Deinococcus peraridilitoris DSM 19664]